jgi:trehalose-6-phosphate synthase
MTSDVIVADRQPVGGAEGVSGGSMVKLICSGLSARPADGGTVWVSPVANLQPTPTVVFGNLSIMQVPVGTDTLDRYYLDVGAGRVWMVLHGMVDVLPADALQDANWDSFIDVNRRVGRAVAEHAPHAARVTVHDYTLLLSVPEIRKHRPDVTLAYVHHVPWPHRDSIRNAASGELMGRLANAAAAADGVSISARQWDANLESWSGTARVHVAHPGINVAELKSRVILPAARGYWLESLGNAARPVIAAVGRVDPAKNVDTLLRAWITLLQTGVHGTVCLHLVPTSRRRVPAYQAYAEAVASLAEAANRIRANSVITVEDEAQTDALRLLQRADIVVTCSRADGWNLVAVEAAALGPDSQHLILSATVGAVDVLGAIAQIVKDPLNLDAWTKALGAAIAGGPRSGPVSRDSLRLPDPKEWADAIDLIHEAAA